MNAQVSFMLVSYHLAAFVTCAYSYLHLLSTRKSVEWLIAPGHMPGFQCHLPLTSSGNLSDLNPWADILQSSGMNELRKTRPAPSRRGLSTLSRFGVRHSLATGMVLESFPGESTENHGRKEPWSDPTPSPEPPPRWCLSMSCFTSRHESLCARPPASCQLAGPTTLHLAASGRLISQTFCRVSHTVHKQFLSCLASGGFFPWNGHMPPKAGFPLWPAKAPSMKGLGHPRLHFPTT